MKNLLVTGSNKGIGFSIANCILQKNLQYNVILCSRDKAKGVYAVNKLRELHPDKKSSIDFGLLDLTSENSITEFKDWYTSKYQTADVIINNAGWASASKDYNFDIQKQNFDTNFDGTIKFQEHMLDSVNKDGKIIIIASITARKVLAGMDKKHSRELFSNKLTMEKLFELKNDLFFAYKNNEANLSGWPAFSFSCYGLSKTFLISYARVLSRNDFVESNNIQVYSMCPGYCKTDMTENMGSRSPDEGALDVVNLTIKSDSINQELQGQFFVKSRVKNFVG